MAELSRVARLAIREQFTHNPQVQVLLATDAAGEGLNLQRAHLMVNYDLPWNPNRIEQRFGRIHRIGQTEVCHLWNLVAQGTREGDVFRTLLSKIDQMASIHGKALPCAWRRTIFDNNRCVSFLLKPFAMVICQRCENAWAALSMSLCPTVSRLSSMKERLSETCRLSQTWKLSGSSWSVLVPVDYSRVILRLLRDQPRPSGCASGSA